MTNLLKIIGIVVLTCGYGTNLMAGDPDDKTIIVFKTEQQLKFKVQDFNQNNIKEVIYFKIDASGSIVTLTADNCGLDYCNYSFSTEGLSEGIYQIQVYIEGYSVPVTKSFSL